jgi:hypothetical protein
MGTTIRPNDGSSFAVKLGTKDWVEAVAIINDAGAVVDPSAPAAGALSMTKAEDAAHASGDVGVAVWGVRNDSGATTHAGTDLDYSPVSVNLKGQIQADVLSATVIGDGALGIAGWDSTGNNNRNLAVATSLFNATTWDRQRGNIDHGTVGITASGATTTQTGADQTNYNHRGAIIVLDMTSVGTGNVTLSVQGKDSLSGKYYTIFTGSAISTNSTNVYTIYPGATATANVSVSYPLPRTWRVTVTANNANATTYTVGASLIL